MDTRKITHPLNVSYLVVGLVFLGIAGSWALRVAGVVDTADARWLVPAVLVLAGAVGLVAFAAKGLSRGDRDDYDGLDDGAPYDPTLDLYGPAPYDDTDLTTRIEGDDR
jgi:hypothetical protein